MATARACIERIIRENIGGRKLVSVERFLQLDDYLKENGLESACYLTLNEEKAQSGEGFVSIREIKNKKNEYYVLVPFEIEDSLRELLFDYGYESVKDYVSMQIMHKTVSNVSNYVDSFGNRCNYIPENVSVTFRGVNAEVHISRSVRAPEKVQLSIDSNVKVRIEDEALLTGSWFVCENGVFNLGKRTGCKLISVRIDKGCEVSIGDDTTFTLDGEIFCVKGKVIIGRDCMIAEKTLFWCGDGHAIYQVKTGERINASETKNTILLGDHVWVGARSILLSHTKIGDGSIVGAGGVVKGEYPNNCVAAGNPCSMKKTDIFWCRDLNGKIKESERPYFRETEKPNVLRDKE